MFFCHVGGVRILKEVPSGTASNLIITPAPHHKRLRRSNNLVTKLPPLRGSTARRLRTPRASDEADIRANVCRCTEPPTTPCGPQMCGDAPISERTARPSAAKPSGQARQDNRTAHRQGTCTQAAGDHGGRHEDGVPPDQPRWQPTRCRMPENSIEGHHDDEPDASGSPPGRIPHRWLHLPLAP